MKREEYVGNIISFICDHVDVEEAGGEGAQFIFVLMLLLDDAIESEVRAVPSLYEQANKVSLN